MLIQDQRVPLAQSGVILSFLSRLTDGITGVGNRIYDCASPLVRSPLFAGLQYVLAVALVAVVLVGVAGLVKITYVALAALAIGTCLVVGVLMLRRRAAEDLGASLTSHQTASNAASLIDAASRGREGTVRILLGLGTDVNARDEQNRTALMCAASRGHRAVLQALLEEQADVNALDREGNTALMLAVDRGQRGIVQALIQAGATVPDAYRDRVTALTQDSGD